MSTRNVQEKSLQFGGPGGGAQDDLPRVLIGSGDAITRAARTRGLIDAGWSVEAVNACTAVPARLLPCPALVLLDRDLAGAEARDTIAAIRALPLPAASVPIVAVTAATVSGRSALIADGFDDMLPQPITAADLAQFAADWHPGEEERALDRLAGAFGAAQIASMTARLRDLLAGAIVTMNAGEVGELAHRIAGVAETVGFARVGQAWRVLSERDGGTDADRAAARRETRRAIALIDRRAVREGTR